MNIRPVGGRLVPYRPGSIGAIIKVTLPKKIALLSRRILWKNKNSLA
jgi:hypothetical protein